MKIKTRKTESNKNDIVYEASEETIAENNMPQQLTFFETKNFRTIVNIINICLIVVLAVYIIMSQVKNQQQKEIVQDTAAVEISADEAIKQAQGTMIEVYLSLVRGMTGEYNGRSLKFGYNNDFSGYYDKDNTSVKDYHYELTAVSDEDSKKGYVANIIIYKDMDSGSVQYKLLFDEAQNMTLYHPDSKINIPLTD